MIIIEGTIRVRDLDQARPHMLQMIEASRAEQGCIDYAYAADLTDPHLIRVTERWQDRPSLQAHFESAHLKTWRECWDRFGITERKLRLYEAEAEEI